MTTPIKVIFKFATETVEVDGYRDLNLLAHAQLEERSLQSRCGGHCECCTCRVKILSGEVNKVTESEHLLLQKAGLSGSGYRLACQTFPEKGTVVIEVPEERFKDQRFKQKST